MRGLAIEWAFYLFSKIGRGDMIVSLESPVKGAGAAKAAGKRNLRQAFTCQLYPGTGSIDTESREVIQKADAGDLFKIMGKIVF